jgi:hypothetical protein
MDTVADVVASLDDPDRSAVHAGRVYDAREFRSQVYKTGNALRHSGVREDVTVAVLDVPEPPALLTFLGASLLGGTTVFDPDPVVEARVLAGPTGELGAYDLPPGGQRVAWGEPPVNPAWTYFERDVWSENPAFPEPSVTEETELLPGLTHGEAVDAATDVAAEYDADDVVALRAPLADTGVVVAGVVAPLLAGASILLPEAGEPGTVAVAGPESEVPEERAVAPESVQY